MVCSTSSQSGLILKNIDIFKTVTILNRYIKPWISPELDEFVKGAKSSESKFAFYSNMYKGDKG